MLIVVGMLLTSQITGMPWIEIDFAADVERATSEILPRILVAEGSANAMMRGGGKTGRSVEQGL